MKKKYVLKNKRRFSLFLMVVLVAVFTVIFATSVYGYKEPAYMTVTVREGDTLWDIARQCTTTQDIRKTLFTIKKINHLASSDIYVGTELLVPLGEQ